MNQSIIQFIITVFIKFLRLQSPDFIFDNADYFSQQNWSWQQQSQWQGECQIGKYQSPITFTDEIATKVYNQMLKFKYVNTMVQAKFDGHEIGLYGDFGSILYLVNGLDSKYQAKKVVFKFPQENIVQGQTHVGELQVYHELDDGVAAIVSFFIDSDPKQTNPSKFWSNLNYNNWNLYNANQFVDVGVLGLQSIIQTGSLNKNYDVSYYLYKGSISSPPCTEGVLHFIMKQPISVSNVIIQGLQRSVYRNDIEYGGNARTVTHYQANIYRPGPIKIQFLSQVQLSPEIEAMINKQKLQLQALENQSPSNYQRLQKKNDGAFVKTTAKLDTLFYDDGKSNAQNIYAQDYEQVDPKQLPNSVLKTLQLTGSTTGNFQIPNQFYQHMDNKKKFRKRFLKRFLKKK